MSIKKLAEIRAFEAFLEKLLKHYPHISPVEQNRLRERLEFGREKYGPYTPGKKDNVAEITPETEDVAIYSFFHSWEMGIDMPIIEKLFFECLGSVIRANSRLISVMKLWRSLNESK